MALKNDETISAFGRRILELLDEMSPRDLATIFYNTGLIKITSRKKWTEKEADDKKHSAISSIERRIREHIHADNPSCLQGEYVQAYCTYFHVSADYLFSYTDIKKPDMEVRAICEKTLLSEKAVLNLLHHDDAESADEKALRNGCWSIIIESNLFWSLPKDWLEAQKQALQYISTKNELLDTEKAYQEAQGKDKLDLGCDVEGLKIKVGDCRAAQKGLLFNLTQNMSMFIEGQINGKAELYDAQYAALRRRKTGK